MIIMRGGISFFIYSILCLQNLIVKLFGVFCLNNEIYIFIISTYDW